MDTMIELKPHPELGICLDVGCGTGPKRPAQQFSAYCDVIPAGQPGVIYPEPYYECPMEDLSVFPDKTFDYVRAHHSLEHVCDPDAACAELVRVGKAGLISVPPPQAEMMFGRRDHNWFVIPDKGRLLIIKKRYPSYGVPRAVTRCQLNVDFAWTGSFKWIVVE